MTKNKEYYENYVCPHCLNTLDNCICELFPPYHLIHIDKNIQEHIRILNEKGYCTRFCCEGHGAGSNTYISFAINYFDDMMIPKNFRYDSKRAMITHSYSSKLTEEEIKEQKQNNLNILLEWCINLPIYTES